MKQGGAFALGEAALTSLAPQQAARLVRAVKAARRDVATAALAVIGALGVEAAEAREVFHEPNHQDATGATLTTSLDPITLPGNCQHWCSTTQESRWPSRNHATQAALRTARRPCSHPPSSRRSGFPA